jgi:hypothetical protein
MEILTWNIQYNNAGLMSGVFVNFVMKHMPGLKRRLLFQIPTPLRLPGKPGRLFCVEISTSNPRIPSTRCLPARQIQARDYLMPGVRKTEWRIMRLLAGSLTGSSGQGESTAGISFFSPRIWLQELICLRSMLQPMHPITNPFG